MDNIALQYGTPNETTYRIKFYLEQYQVAKNREANPPPIPDDGLLKFYSAEAEAMLAQYKRIDFLLGSKSSDHTHTGTLCEILLRDYFRRVLLSWMGVDKGFVYGRSIEGIIPRYHLRLIS